MMADALYPSFDFYSRMLDLSANKEKDGVTVPRGTVTVPIPSKYLSLKIRAVPLPKNVMELLASHTSTIKHIVEQKIARRNAQKQNEDVDIEEIKADNITGELSEEKILSAAEFQDMLKKEFQIAQAQGGPLASLWDGIVDQYVLYFIVAKMPCRYILPK
jgi:ribosome assembly protein 1